MTILTWRHPCNIVPEARMASRGAGWTSKTTCGPGGTSDGLYYSFAPGAPTMYIFLKKVAISSAVSLGCSCAMRCPAPLILVNEACLTWARRSTRCPSSRTDRPSSAKMKCTGSSGGSVWSREKARREEQAMGSAKTSCMILQVRRDPA